VGSYNLLAHSNTPIAFSDVINWTHSWDAEDAVLYNTTSDEVAAFSFATFGNNYVGPVILGQPRISHIPDKGTGNKPLAKDTGPWTFYSSTPAPGPLLISGSNRYRGRKYWYTDVLLSLPPGFGFTPSLATMLTPNADPGDLGTATWFNPPHGFFPPYTVAVLAKLTNTSVPWYDVGTASWIPRYVNSAFMDTYRGLVGAGPTWSTGLFDGTKYGVSCFGPNDVTGIFPGFHVEIHPHLYPFVDSSGTLISGKEEAMIAIQHVAVGVNASWMELNFRKDDGTIGTEREYMTLGSIPNNLGFPFEELFNGYVHISFNSALGIKTGTPIEEEISAIRNWGSRYI